MNDEIRNLYAQLTMSDECARRILEAARRPQPKLRFRPGAAAAVLALLLTVGVVTARVQAAQGNVARYLFLNQGWHYSKSIRPTGDGRILPGCYLEVGNGRILLFHQGERRDITDLVSPEVPYIHTYTDHRNILHILVIGGSRDNIGLCLFTRQAEAGQGPYDGWLEAASHNLVDPKTWEAYPWVTAAWDVLDIPWPEP